MMNDDDRKMNAKNEIKNTNNRQHTVDLQTQT
jgi:hypothetical protein